MQKGFLGTYDATIDDKGRVRLPVKFRNMLGEGFVVTQGTENCLCVYPQEAWEALTADVLKLGSLDPEVTKFRRSLFANAVEGDFDAAGRVPIAKRLMEYANLKKDVVLVGANTRLEIWDSEAWEKNDVSSAEARAKLQAAVAAKEERLG